MDAYMENTALVPINWVSQGSLFLGINQERFCNYYCYFLGANSGSCCKSSRALRYRCVLAVGFPLRSGAQAARCLL
jgi:hypothetical protein